MIHNNKKVYLYIYIYVYKTIYISQMRISSQSDFILLKIYMVL